jgi:hypothetical protein
MLASDLAGTEGPDGNYSAMLSLGVSKSSLMGDKSYSASALIWSTLDQFAVSGGMTQMRLENGKLHSLHSYSLTTAYLKGTYMGMVGYTFIKPHPKLGTYGANVGFITLLMPDATQTLQSSFSTSVVLFWMKPYQYSRKLSISPQVFVMNSPLGYNSVTGGTIVTRIPSSMLGASFDYKISKRFGFNFAYKANMSYEPKFTMLSNFQIGSKVSF